MRRGAKPYRSAQSPPAALLSASASTTLERILPLSDLLVVQCFIAAGMAVGVLFGESRWYGAAAGLGMALVLVVRIRGRSIPHWTSARLGYWYERWRRKHRTECENLGPFDANLSDGAKVGFRWDGKILMSLVRILEDTQAMTVMEPAMTVSGQTVTATILADCLQQFDIALESIDVISQGARSYGRSHIGSVYEAVLGPLPAIAQRAVWVTVRFDPTLCADAVRHRGGDWQGIVRAAATATRRVANRLSDAGLRTQILAADEITQATNELSHGMDLSSLDETWLACHDGRYQLRSYCLKASMFTTAGLNLLWTVPSDSTAVCISLRRDQRDDVIKLRGLVRFEGYGSARVPLPNLGQLPGRQYAAMMSSLPLPSPRRSVAEWVFGKGVDAVADLELPISGCGQVVGADQRGRAVALPLFGPQVRRVEMCGTLHLAQQVVLRSLALGAQVRVHSRRPAAWSVMAKQVGDDNLLSINDNGDSIQVASNLNYPVEVFDGTAEPTVQNGATRMVVKPLDAKPTRAADVTLQLLDHNRDLVQVGTRSASATVTMVATPDEMGYIKSSLDVVD